MVALRQKSCVCIIKLSSSRKSEKRRKKLACRVQKSSWITIVTWVTLTYLTIWKVYKRSTERAKSIDMFFTILMSLRLINTLYTKMKESFPVMDLEGFRWEIIPVFISLSNEGTYRKMKLARTTAIKSHKPYIPPEKILERADHNQVVSSRRRCATHTKKHIYIIKWMCVARYVPLCMQAKSNCFTKYHSK